MGREASAWLVLVALTAAPVVAHAEPAPALAGSDAGSPDAGMPEQAPVDAGSAAEPPDAATAEAPTPAPQAVPAPAIETTPLTQTPTRPSPTPIVEPLAAGADRDTGIAGRIVGGDDKGPLEAAPVLATDGAKTRTALTDERGRYRFYLPPGRYAIRSYYDLFHGARIDQVRVRRGSFTTVDLVLDPIDEEAEVVVEEMEIPYRADTTTASAQDQLRQASAGIGEGMGAEQMSRAGAGDAESAAKRVVGVTIDSKQLVIRGLGGRYTRVLLNGDPVPSTDPDRPGVDLDLFPTSVIDSFSVQKVFLPEMPADFAGGVLEINTVSYPRDFTLEAGVSAGANTESTLRKRLDYDGGRYDFLGFDDGRRAIPDSVPSDEPVRITRESSPDRFKTSEEIDVLAEDFRNVWALEPTKAWPKIGIDATVGDALDLPDRARFGYMVATVYDHKDIREHGHSERRLADVSSIDFEEGSEQVLFTTLATAGLDLGLDHTLTLLTMLNRNVEDETQYREGTRLATGPFEEWQLGLVTRTLWFNQLRGDHRNLGGGRLRLRWSSFYAVGERDEPDRRGIEYGTRGGVYRWDDKAGSGERFFSELAQADLGGRANLRLPLWTEAWGTIGGSAHHAARNFEIRRFLMEPLMVDDQNLFAAPPEELFSDEGIGTLTRMREQTRPNDSYEARQTLFAGFGQVETPVLGSLSAAGGARVEIFTQDLLALSPFEEAAQVMRDETNSIDATDTDVLPGAALKYALSEDMFVRSAYAITLGRAQVRELAPYDYYDFVRERTISGNPELVQTTIHNVDVRWEWFFDEAQVFALSGFYKQFLDPIELQRQNATNSQYLNADSATSVGAEAELRLNLGHLDRAVEHFDLETNVALIHSRVRLPQGEFGVERSERPMFGQAPYVVNVGLHYFEPSARVRCGLVYNVVGPRITETGKRAGDLILENAVDRPFHSLDLVGSWKFAEHFSLKLKVKNLLLQTKRADEREYFTKETHTGTEGSIGFAYVH